MFGQKEGNCRGNSSGRYVQHIVYYENAKGKKSSKPKKGYKRKQRNIVHLLGKF